MSCGCEPVGLKEIAERLGVSRITPKTWVQRGVLPPPRWTASGVSLWNWPELAAWARTTGRLPAPAAADPL